jgi:phosphoglycerate dehydrogenase-like enzyme
MRVGILGTGMVGRSVAATPAMLIGLLAFRVVR